MTCSPIQLSFRMLPSIEKGFTSQNWHSHLMELRILLMARSRPPIGAVPENMKDVPLGSLKDIDDPMMIRLPIVSAHLYQWIE